MFLLAQSNYTPESQTNWGLVFMGIVFLLVVINAYRGWKAGLYRKLFSIFALAGAYAAAWFVGPIVGDLASEHISYPQTVLNLLGGAVVGTIVWLFLTIIGLFTPKTEDSDSLSKMRVVGIGGAMAGTLLGLMYSLLLVIFVQLVGTLSESQLKMDEAINGFEQTPATTAQANSDEQEEGPFLETLDTKDVTSTLQTLSKRGMQAFANMKHALEDNPLTPVFETIDPVPEKVYRIANKIKILASSPKALENFKNHPASQELLKHQAVIELTQDLEVMELARNRDINGILKHPRVIAVLDNEELKEFASEYDIEIVMDEALAQAGITVPDTAPPEE